jgi:hypothetical protein
MVLRRVLLDQSRDNNNITARNDIWGDWISFAPLTGVNKPNAFAGDGDPLGSGASDQREPV